MWPALVAKILRGASGHRFLFHLPLDGPALEIFDLREREE